MIDHKRRLEMGNEGYVHCKRAQCIRRDELKNQLIWIPNITTFVVVIKIFNLYNLNTATETHKNKYIKYNKMILLWHSNIGEISVRQLYPKINWMRQKGIPANIKIKIRHRSARTARTYSAPKIERITRWIIAFSCRI